MEPYVVKLTISRELYEKRKAIAEAARFFDTVRRFDQEKFEEQERALLRLRWLPLQVRWPGVIYFNPI